MREITATVVKNEQIAKDIFALTFDCGERIQTQAGQFCMLGAKGFPLRRPIAICKAEGEQITVCFRLKGEGTKSLSALKAGETLSALLPLGNGFPMKEEWKKIALVGGGVGIFPLVSVIGQYGAEKQIHAYMGFRNQNALCMQEEMGRAGKLVLASDDGSFGFHGTSVEVFLQGGEKYDAVLSCGPTPMLRALKEVKDAPVYVSLEERMGCGIGACLVCVCGKKDGSKARVCKDGPVFEISEVEL